MKKLAENLDAYIILGWLNTAEAENYFLTLQKLPWQTETLNMYGKQITVPRKVLCVADEGVEYKYSGKNHLPQPWSKELTALRKKLKPIAEFNSVLCNYYANGNDYMGWHSDDERALSEQLIIASVSLGAERRFLFRHKKTNEKVEVALNSGSLLIMQGDSQLNWQHSLPKSTKVTSPRINLTFRTIFAC